MVVGGLWMGVEKKERGREESGVHERKWKWEVD
jgi:hypothetical protein